MTDLDYGVICERAKMLLDSPLSDEDVAARYRRFFGAELDVLQVSRARLRFADRMRKAEGVTIAAASGDLTSRP